jgi:sugar transferase (PEP-CTERM system associated)
MIRLFNQYVSAKSILLVGLECLLILMSLVLGAKLRFWNRSAEFLTYIRSESFLFQAVTVLLVLGACCYYNDLYDLTAVRARRGQFVRLAQALGAAFILLGLLVYMVPGTLAGHKELFLAVGGAALAIGGMRVGLDLVWPLTQRRKNVLILGIGDMALTIARELADRADLNFRVVGFVAPSATGVSQLCGRPVLGIKDDLCSITRDQHASRIIVALDDFRGALPTRDLVRLRVQGIQVEDAHTTLAALTGRVWLRTVRPSWFVFSNGFHRSHATLLIKRVFDLAFGFLGVILFAPVMALIAIAIRLDSKGPALYRQTRVGLAGEAFGLLKFRSMRLDAEEGIGPQWAQKDDPRITNVGRFLRKYRLDELPQFLNVIRGEMSFVGPRPERPAFVEQLREQIAFYDERHSVRPGVTGWAQVEYRYGASVEDAFRKLEYDLFYLKSLSILFDIAIVFRTVRVVLFGAGR